ncbi:hypothetical protein FQZ97_607030 [compost metagenome]
MRGREDLGAVHGEQRLVGRDHVLAGRDGLEHQLLGDAVAADELDDDVDVGVGDDFARIGDHLHAFAGHFAGTGGVEVGHHGDLDAAAGAAFDFFLVALEHLEGAAADRACAEQAYLDGFHGRGRVHGLDEVRDGAAASTRRLT